MALAKTAGKQKLQSKDLIIAGAFAALYIVVMFACVTLTGFMPLVYLFSPLILAIVLGPIWALYVAKIPKRGAILILAILVGLLTTMGGIWQTGVWALIIGIAAELIAFAGKYKSRKAYLISYMVFACTNMGPFLMIFFAKSAFLEQCIMFYGTEYAATIDAFTPPWLILVLIALALIGGLLGGLFGQKLVRKHFKKAGVV